MIFFVLHVWKKKKIFVHAYISQTSELWCRAGMVMNIFQLIGMFYLSLFVFSGVKYFPSSSLNIVPSGHTVIIFVHLVFHWTLDPNLRLLYFNNNRNMRPLAKLVVLLEPFYILSAYSHNFLCILLQFYLRDQHTKVNYCELEPNRLFSNRNLKLYHTFECQALHYAPSQPASHFWRLNI